MNSLLKNIPDKRVDKNTTSLKFKEDLIEFFQNLNLKNCVEIGTSLGYSAYILSHLFENVTTIDIDISNIRKASEFNYERKNIIFLHGNSTSSDWDVEYKFDVAFIDADHSYNAVLKDIEKCINYGTDNMYIVFDDYGLPDTKPGVKMAVDEVLNKGLLKVVKYIGEPAGNEPRIGKPLIDWEGLICQVV
jgi:predicted O-methyltransferase YrrM